MRLPRVFAAALSLAFTQSLPAHAQALFWESPSRGHDDCTVLRVANGSSLWVDGKGLVTRGKCTIKPGWENVPGTEVMRVRIIGENKLRLADGRTMCATAEGTRVRLNAC